MNVKCVFLTLALTVCASFALAEDVDPRALTYRVRSTTIELDGTTQRLSGDVALVISATQHAATVTVHAQEGLRDPSQVELRGEVRADVLLPASAFPGVEGTAQLRCSRLRFDPVARTVVFHDARYSARATGDYAGTLDVTGIDVGTLDLNGPNGPKLTLTGESLEVEVVPVPTVPAGR